MLVDNNSMKRHRPSGRLQSLCVLLLALTLLGCEQKPLLERIQTHGELLVATRNTPSCYYEGPEGPAGLEYDLVSLFAEELGVKARFVFPDSFADILPAVRSGKVHMAAAGLTITPERRANNTAFSKPYQEITAQLVYRRGTRRPKNLGDLGDGNLEVVAGSSHEERLHQLQQTTFPQLHWNASSEYDSEELIYLVNEQVIDYTVADSNEVALNRRFYPRIKPAFNISDPEPLAWAFAKHTDHSLLDAANTFMLRIMRDGTLAGLIERYHGYTEQLNFVDKRDFWRHVARRLPKYEDLFRQAAEKYGYDWRLLAAIGYQESHWNPKAKSPTGVRGIMMLTRNTAKRLGVDNRLDPEQSIFGGAAYLRMLEQTLPERIPEPDRSWLALAGYNVGFGHLEDARILTERQGGDPDRWVDIKQRLPLLSKKRFYKTLKHGYARGREPVTYVDNIRNFYDLLVWYTNNLKVAETDDNDTKEEPLSEAKAAAIELPTLPP